MMAEEYFRRTTDASNIEALIASENDPGKRTLLLILSSLNHNLIENTKTTEAVRKELAGHLKAFNAHVDAENAMLNKGRGAGKVLMVLLGTVQVIIGIVVATLLTRIESYDQAIVALKLSDARIETALRVNRELIGK